MSGEENVQCVPGRKFMVRWCVKNFSMFGPRLGQSEKSQTFVVPLLGDTKWYLKLLAGKTRKKNIMCFLCREDDGPEYVNSFYSISVFSSYVEERQTFARESSCIIPGIFSRRDFNECVCRGLYRDLLEVECRLWPDSSTEVPNPVVPYLVGIEMVTVIPKERKTMFYEMPKLTSDKFWKFSVESVECCFALTCQLTLEEQTINVIIRGPERMHFPFALKCNVHLLDAFGDKHLLARRRYRFMEKDSLLKFPFELSVKQMMEEKDRYLPFDNLLLHWEFIYSHNLNIRTFINRTLYHETSDLQVNHEFKWVIFLVRKYNEHFLFFRLLALLAVVFSVLPTLIA